MGSEWFSAPGFDLNSSTENEGWDGGPAPLWINGPGLGETLNLVILCFFPINYTIHHLQHEN